MTTMRAKMKISSVTKYESSENLRMTAVCKSTAYPTDGSDEDNTFSTFTPNAELSITIQNPALLNHFEAGQTFYVDFSPTN